MKRSIILICAIILNIFSVVSQTNARRESPGISFIKEDGSKATLKIKEVAVEVKVLGSIATTTMDITFENELDRILEGELYFPLAEGQTVSRFAMDVNGKLREGVVVEKTKGRVVFEEIVRRRVDPGLLEKTAGNSFKSRVYPIPAKGTKRIVIAYEEVLPEYDYGMNYNLPLNFPNELESFTLKAVVYNTLIQPNTNKNEIPDTKFEKSNDGFALLTKLKNYTADKLFAFSMPSNSNENKIAIEEFNGKNYFLINTFPKIFKEKKNLPKKICLFFDISSSAEKRDLNKELDVLEKYLSIIKNCTIELIPFHINAEKSEIFKITNGNVKKLVERLKSFRYDGATSLGNLDFNKYQCDEFLLFSDGISNFGEKEIKLAKTPIIAINSNQTAEHSYLKYLTNSTGGNYINLMQLNAEHATEAMQNSVYSFISAEYDKSKIKETYPSTSTPINGRFSISGLMEVKDATITLNYGIGNKILYSEKYTLNRKENQTTSGLIPRLWASKKLAELELRSEKNNDAITALGKEYSIVTRNTSLIVLETLSDYLKYKIVPPDELKEEYFKQYKETVDNSRKDSIQHKENVLNSLKSRKKWYDTEYPLVITNPDSGEVSVPGRATLVTTIDGFDRGTFERINIKLFNRKEKYNYFLFNIDSLKFLNVKPDDYEINVNLKGYLPFKSKIEIKPDFKTNFVAKLVENPIYADSVRKYRNRIKHNQDSIANYFKNKNDLYSLLGFVNDTSFHKPIEKAVITIDTTSIDLKCDTNGANNHNNFIESRRRSSEGLVLKIESDANGAFVIPKLSKGYHFIEVSWHGMVYINLIKFDTDTILIMKYEYERSKYPLNIQECFASNNNNLYTQVLSEDEYSSMDVIERASAEGGNGIDLGGFASNIDFSEKSLSSKEDELTPTISLKPYTPEAPYIDSLKNLANDEFILKYLKLKEEYGSNPGFYLDISDMLAEKNKELALKVLSNIAELKLEDSQLLRILAHRMKQLGYYQLAVLMFEEVLKMREEEPQSYRDLALAYLENKEYQKAADNLFKVISTKWNWRFPEIELIAIEELNRVIKEAGGLVITVNYWSEILVDMPLDMRVVMTWDSDQTDIDLWVTDPCGSKCYYGNKQTKNGGLLSSDLTGGYGPEEYLMKNAFKGKYKIEANYYGNYQQNINGPVVLHLTVYTKWMSKEETKKEITVRLKDEGDEVRHIEIGEIEYK